MSVSAVVPKLSGQRGYVHEWAVVDVETSGLRPHRDRVLSLAVITLDGDGRQTGEYSTLLDPGCDPGPVHVHGLTRARLRGAPTFDAVMAQVGSMLRGRVMVAHNAQFDYGFLAHEFARARSSVPVDRRLCTIALNRQVGSPTPDLKLGTLAGHYGVRQRRAHDALDDTRVLAGVLRGSLTVAARIGVPLPLVACPPRQDPGFQPQPPKTPCAFRNPGRFVPGEGLRQGMKVAFTGDTAVSRAELVARAVAAGLNVMSSVSRLTSVLVTNDGRSGSTKARRAADEGVPVIDEREFMRLLGSVRPGIPHGVDGGARPVRGPAAAAPTAPEGTIQVPSASATPMDAESVVPGRPVNDAAGGDVSTPREVRSSVGPFSRRRVLILGGTHEAAARARERVVQLGGSAAVNLSASVTDVVLLDRGEEDGRMARVGELGLPVHPFAWLTEPVSLAVDAGSRTSPGPSVLPRGGVVDLPDTSRSPRWTVTATWAHQTRCEIDVVAFAVDDEHQVACDEEFVFYNSPENPDGTVRLSTDGPTAQSIVLDLDRMPAGVRTVVVAASIDGEVGFGDVGAIEISAAPGEGAGAFVEATLDAATTERTMLLAEIYRRGPGWRFRAIGRGYDDGLSALARRYGVDVDD